MDYKLDIETVKALVEKMNTDKDALQIEALQRLLRASRLNEARLRAKLAEYEQKSEVA